MSGNIFEGDCLEVLSAFFEENSVDALVTDPPAGISFMGKEWDSDKGGRDEWVAWFASVMRECHRVLKPGGHGLVWAIPRTSHWTGTALELAGFEVRDCITHLFGSGFPKSLDVSKQLDKMAGAKREVVGKNPNARPSADADLYSINGGKTFDVTAPATDAAKHWAGWGTALKPAAEFWFLIRKPLGEKTVSQNVLKYGTGALNIDSCRVGTEERKNQQKDTKAWKGNSWGANPQPSKDEFKTVTGRFPANLVLSHTPECEESPHVFPDGSTESQCADDCPVRLLDAQSGTLKSGSRAPGVRKGMGFRGADGDGGPAIEASFGGASRFFYCAKVSASERNAGLEGMPDRTLVFSEGARQMEAEGGVGYSPSEQRSGMNKVKVVKNNHPTVKPLKLMRYLCRLITPPGGIVLDPFAGSGSTLVAAKQEGFQFIGIEREAEYVEIARKRIENA